MKPEKWIPKQDIAGLVTLVKRGWPSRQIANYYKSHGIDVSHSTIARKVKGVVLE